MKAVTSSVTPMSRHKTQTVAYGDDIPPVIGTVVATCVRQQDRPHGQWLQVLNSRGGKQWWFATARDVEVGQYLRLEPETGEAWPVPAAMAGLELETLYALCPQPSALDRLLWLIAGITHDGLRGMMLEVLRDMRIAHPFVQVAASCRHHHSEPGGLLRHTVECGEWVQSWSAALPDLEAAVTLVATLCHDIGKTKTMTLSQTTSDMGQMVTHEIAGLQILQPHIERLRHDWPRIADALLHMLSWRPSRHEPLPRLPGLVMLKHADQFSTVMDLRARAFDHAPAHHFWSKPHADQGQRFHQIG